MSKSLSDSGLAGEGESHRQTRSSRLLRRRTVMAAGATAFTGLVINRAEATTSAETVSLDSMTSQHLAVRHGNVLPALNASFHPPNRPLSHVFDGNSHPLGQYFSTLTDARALYPHATSLSDEADWAALQAAVNSVISYPRGWGGLRTDWEQRGTAIIDVPVDADIKVNRPIVKGAHANRNLVLRSATPWGARIEYTGSDGGRIIDFERESVGSVLGIENMLLWKGGIRVRAPYRGDLRIGDGLLVRPKGRYGTTYLPRPKIVLTSGGRQPRASHVTRHRAARRSEPWGPSWRADRQLRQ